jgi:hypothetical protein
MTPLWVGSVLTLKTSAPLSVIAPVAKMLPVVPLPICSVFPALIVVGPE